MTEIETRVVAAWHQAAADLGFQFTSPFTVRSQDGRNVEFLGIIHNFGGRAGAVISVLNEPSYKSRIHQNPDYFASILGSVYQKYDRQLFIDTLDDWQFFGPETERPAWYSGKNWSN